MNVITRMLPVSALLLTLAIQAAPPVPRPAGALAIQEPSGKKTTLASMKGSVVVVQFLLTSCPHCQTFSKALTKITAEMPQVKGMGVKFLKDDTGGVPDYAKLTGANFAIGTADEGAALGFLGYSVMDMPRLRVPQVVVIDKKGNIRSQTDLGAQGPAGNEPSLRSLLATLVKE
jgi:peroxiredoxin